MLGNKPPYTTMQQLNLDWVLSKLKTLLRLVPDDGAVGQILRRTRDGAVWSDEQGGGGGGAVESVNGKTGAVVLDADDVGALPDDYTPPVTSVNGQTGAVTVSVPVQSVNGKTGAVMLGKSDVGLANVDNVRQYSATNPPPYPVTSVNGQTGAVVIPAGGNVDSVNGQTGAVVLDAADVGALPDDYTPPVTSVNGQTGAVVIPINDPQLKRVGITQYTIGSTVQVPELPVKNSSYIVLVLFRWSTANYLPMMPTTVEIPAGTQNFTLSFTWDTNEKTLKNSGNVDLYIVYLD